MFEVAKKFAQMQKDIDNTIGKILTEKITQYVGRELSQSQIVEMIERKSLIVIKYVVSDFTSLYSIKAEEKEEMLHFTITIVPINNEQSYEIIVEEEL